MDLFGIASNIQTARTGTGLDNARSIISGKYPQTIKPIQVV
jgi:hypothetical protein